MDSNIFPGATEQTPSLAQYFSWINNTNEGATEEQTLINLEFFQWLLDEYGMALDIYAWDAGNLDGPSDGYGSFDSEKFLSQYPNGYGPIAEKCREIGCRLGLWGGPDGFGDTPEDARKRIETMVSLCRDYQMMLFKFDGVCGTLRPEKQDAFVEMMTECRKYSPDLILLNHRLQLGKGMPHATTWLWEGKETYIDIFMSNETTAPHNRAGALGRGLPPELQRLTEDHGVCLSSCLDYWEDDLILQAFNRCLILAPEIYGNPWLLRDDEYPRLARIYNLHRRYRDIMVNGLELPEAQYGPYAVARGNASTRLITLRNLGWEPVEYQLSVSEQIGLTAADSFEVRQFHPTECILGRPAFGESLSVKVEPFRSCLLIVSSVAIEEPAIEGCDFEVIHNVPGRPVEIDLLGMPGTSVTVRGEGGLEQTVDFEGSPLTQPWHRKLADLKSTSVPTNAQALYEATCFAADNNALEAQELRRSGSTDIPQVRAARDAFFGQELFWARGVWDRYMFDGRNDTFFGVWGRGVDRRVRGGALRIDLGAGQDFDQVSLEAVWPDDREGDPATSLTLECSVDLLSWQPVQLTQIEEASAARKIAEVIHNGGDVNWHDAHTVRWTASQPISGRYIRIIDAPDRVSDFSLANNGQALSRDDWHATHLFAPYASAPATGTLQATVKLGNEAPNSYLCIAVEGEHGRELVYAAASCDGQPIGASRRALSYPCVTWECNIQDTSGHTTHYIPVTPEMHGKEIDLYLLLLEGAKTDLHVHAWITAYPAPFVRKRVTMA